MFLLKMFWSEWFTGNEILKNIDFVTHQWLVVLMSCSYSLALYHFLPIYIRLVLHFHTKFAIFKFLYVSSQVKQSRLKRNVLMSNIFQSIFERTISSFTVKGAPFHRVNRQNNYSTSVVPTNVHPTIYVLIRRTFKTSNRQTWLTS